MPSGRENFARTGLPLVGLVVGGWLGISWILQGRFDVKVIQLDRGGDLFEKGKLYLLIPILKHAKP